MPGPVSCDVGMEGWQSTAAVPETLGAVPQERGAGLGRGQYIAINVLDTFYGRLTDVLDSEMQRFYKMAR